MQHIKKNDFAGEIWVFYYSILSFFTVWFTNMRAYSRLWKGISFVKIDQGIHMLQLKMGQKFSLLTSLLFGCFHQYLRNLPQSLAKFPLSMCCITWYPSTSDTVCIIRHSLCVTRRTDINKTNSILYSNLMFIYTQCMDKVLQLLFMYCLQCFVILNCLDFWALAQ